MKTLITVVSSAIVLTAFAAVAEPQTNAAAAPAQPAAPAAEQPKAPDTAKPAEQPKVVETKPAAESAKPAVEPAKPVELTGTVLVSHDKEGKVSKVRLLDDLGNIYTVTLDDQGNKLSAVDKLQVVKLSGKVTEEVGSMGAKKRTLTVEKFTIVEQPKDAKAEVKAEPKAEVKAEAKPEAKPEAKAEPKAETK